MHIAIIGSGISGLTAAHRLQRHSREDLMPVFARHYGPADAARWFGRWRMFFMACAELWGHRQDREWCVAYYLLEPGAARTAGTQGEAA